MRKFRTIISVIIMVLSGLVGLFVGASLDCGLQGVILFSMIAGIACIIYAIDNRNE